MKLSELFTEKPKAKKKPYITFGLDEYALILIALIGIKKRGYSVRSQNRIIREITGKDINSSALSRYKRLAESLSQKLEKEGLTIFIRNGGK